MLKASWKSLMGRKVRLLLSTFAIVLGVGFVCGSLIFTDTLSRSFDAIFASSVGDVVVRPVGGTSEDGAPTTRTIPAGLVDDLARVEGAERADGNVSAFGVYVVGKNGKVVGGQGAPGIGVNWTDAPAAGGLEGLSVTDGREPRREGEVVVDEGTAERAGYQIGDRVPLVTSSAEPSAEAELVGLAAFGEGGSTNGASISAFDTATAQRLFLGGRDAYTDAWVTAADGVGQAELRDSVAETLPAGVEALTGRKVADEQAGNLAEAISFISTFLLIFAGIALVVGGFLIVNTFSILVAQRSRELALFRAVGASRRQVTWSVLFEAFVLGLLGATLGLGLGVALALGIRALFATFGLDLSGAGLVFAPRTVLAAYAVGVVVTMLAAFVPARRSSRIPPVAALRDDVAMPESALRRRLFVGAGLIVAGAGGMLAGLYADVPSPGWWVGGGVLAALLGVAAASPVISHPFLVLASGLFRRTFGAVGHLAGQNSLRNPRRTAATASALMIGLALVSTMAILGSSAKGSVDKAVEENFVADLVVSNVIGQPFSPAIADRAAETDGVAAVTRVRYSFLREDGSTRIVIAIEPGSFADAARAQMVDGELADLGDGEVLVSEGTARDRSVGVGDEVELPFPAGEQSLQVAGIYSDNDPVLDAPYTTTLATLADAGFPPADNYAFVALEDGADAAAVQNALEEQTAKQPLVTVKDQAGFAEEAAAPIDQLLSIVYALLALALVIAVLGIVNTLALSIIERTREVGLLRAVGLSRRQLRSMVRLEAVVVAVLGAVLGVAMGIVFGVALMTSLEDDGLEVLRIPVGQLVVFVLVAAVVGVLAAVLPARRAARLDVLRAIATE